MTTQPFGLGGIGQISIIVKDVERAVAFYRDVLGLKFLFQFPGMAFFDCDGIRLYLDRAQKPGLGTSVLYYRVSSIQEAAAALKQRGVRVADEPEKVHEDARHELWLAFFLDSEDNHFALMSEVAKQ